MTTNVNVRKLTESAILIAVAVVLSVLIRIFPMPFGGDITGASIVPLLIISYRYGIGWGTLSATVYGILQMMLLGFFGLAGTALDFAIVILFDYIVAFGVLGLAELFRKPFKGRDSFFAKYFGYAFSCIIVMFLRFLCHFVSGVIVWSAIAPEVAESGMNPVIYSLVYNSAYMIPETIISCVIIVLLIKCINFNKTV